MKKMPGNDDFGKRFDYYKWSAPIYETPQEVMTLLERKRVQWKKLKHIYVIGYSPNYYFNLYSELYTRLQNIGYDIDYSSSSWYDNYENKEKVLFPCKARFFEPIQFVFAKGETMEFLPESNGGARIGFNSIPIGMTDGLNRSNIDFQKFIGTDIIGDKLESVRIKKTTTLEQNFETYSDRNSKPYIDSRTRYKYIFKFKYPREIIVSDGHGFDIEFKGRGYPDAISYEEIKKARKAVKQVPIDDNGMFSIHAFNSKSDNCEGRASFTMDEDLLWDYLSVFLIDFFDLSIHDPYRDGWENDGFEAYGSNCYTVKRIREMLETIKIAITLFKLDYDNPILDEIKRRISIYKLIDEDTSYYNLSDEDRERIKKDNVDVIIDFYKRFIERMETMLEMSKNCDMVCFTGP